MILLLIKYVQLHESKHGSYITRDTPSRTRLVEIDFSVLDYSSDNSKKRWESAWGKELPILELPLTGTTHNTDVWQMTDRDIHTERMVNDK